MFLLVVLTFVSACEAIRLLYFFPPGGCLCAIFAISALKLYSWNFLTARVEQLLDLNIGLAYDKSRLRLL